MRLNPIPHRTPFFLPWLYPNLIWRLPGDSKTLYLTFDDGPVGGPTDFVLEALRKYKAKATFFCIGNNIQKHPAVFKKIWKDGHIIGNHTFNHISGWQTGAKDYWNNIRQCEQEIKSHTLEGGNGIKFFRPPYGRITRSQIHMISDHYKIIMWDVLAVDFSKSLSPESCLKNTISAARPGSIVIFHDSFKAERNLTFALPRFIEHFSEKGFVFKVITV